MGAKTYKQRLCLHRRHQQSAPVAEAVESIKTGHHGPWQTGLRKRHGNNAPHSQPEISKYRKMEGRGPVESERRWTTRLNPAAHKQPPSIRTASGPGQQPQGPNPNPALRGIKDSHSGTHHLGVHHNKSLAAPEQPSRGERGGAPRGDKAAQRQRRPALLPPTKCAPGFGYEFHATQATATYGSDLGKTRVHFLLCSTMFLRTRKSKYIRYPAGALTADSTHPAPISR